MQTQERLTDRIRLQTTRLHDSSVHWRFTCPLMHTDRACQRRVGTLSLPPGGRVFGCRYCYALPSTRNKQSPRDARPYATLAADMPGTDWRAVQRLLRYRWEV